MWIQVIFIVFSLPFLACGQEVAAKVQDDWLAPALPDESITLTATQPYEVRWNANITRWFPGYAPSAKVNNVTLWVTGTYQAQFSNIVASFVDLTTTQSVKWTVNLPADQLQQTEYWGFAFLPSGAKYVGATGEQVSSPRIKIRPRPTTTFIRTGPPTSSSTATSSPSSAPAATLVSAPKSISTGAVAGIAVGTAILALIVGAAVWIFFRRRKRAREEAVEAQRRHEQNHAAPEFVEQKPDYHEDVQPPHYYENSIMPKAVEAETPRVASPIPSELVGTPVRTPELEAPHRGLFRRESSVGSPGA